MSLDIAAGLMIVPRLICFPLTRKTQAPEQNYQSPSTARRNIQQSGGQTQASDSRLVGTQWPLSRPACVMSGIDFMTIAKWVGHKDGGVLVGKVHGHLSSER